MRPAGSNAQRKATRYASTAVEQELPLSSLCAEHRVPASGVCPRCGKFTCDGCTNPLSKECSNCVARRPADDFWPKPSHFAVFLGALNVGCVAIGAAVYFTFVPGSHGPVLLLVLPFALYVAISPLPALLGLGCAVYAAKIREAPTWTAAGLLLNAAYLVVYAVVLATLLRKLPAM